MASLEDLARTKVTDPPLSPAEERVLRAASDGTFADCLRDLGGGSNPANAKGTGETPDEKWPETRNVRADLIRWLCVDREARDQVDQKGIQIQGARITEPLDLSSTNVLVPLVLFDCRLEGNLNLTWAKMPLLSLEGSWTKAIGADGLKLEGGLFLRNGFHAEGEVRLLGATIGGDLSARGGAFKSSNDYAINASNIKVYGNVLLSEKFVAQGEVKLQGAEVNGQLEVVDAWIQDELSLESANITGVFLWKSIRGEPSLNLRGAKVGL
jgi:hypothetical protein